MLNSNLEKEKKKKAYHSGRNDLKPTEHSQVPRTQQDHRNPRGAETEGVGEIQGADLRDSPATAAVVGQELRSQQTVRNLAAEGLQRHQNARKVLKELEETGGLGLRVCSVPTETPFRKRVVCTRTVSAQGLLVSCLHTGTAPRLPLTTRRAQGHSRQVAAALGAGLSGPNMQWLRHCHVPKEVIQATTVSPVTYSHA